MTGSQENYSLRWNNHQSHILKSFDALKNSESLVDVTLVCSDRSLRAHKVVLSACSPFFEKVFNDTPCKHPVIVLKDFRGWIVQAIVNFMYRGEISVTQGKLDQLIKAGESLQIRGLIGAVPFTVPSETDISAVREGCTSPMPRRKQARPRRRSEELELPQDLSNGTAMTKDDQHSESEDEGCEKDEFSVSKRFKREIGLREEVKSCDEIKRFDDEVIESEEKENHPRDHPTDAPENLSMKRASEGSSENLSGDRNNNNNGDEKKRSSEQQNDFHERFILSLKDLKHLRRQGPSTHPFSDILSQLPITPPHSFHMNHLESKEAHNMKGDSDQSDGESAPFADQLDLIQHRNNLNSNMEKMSRERQRHQPNPGMPFPPHFHPNDGQMRGSVHHGHSSSPLSFPSMSSGLTLTPPHMFGLESPLGFLPPGMDPSKMYNPMMDMSDHRSLHQDSQPFLKKKLARPKGQHSAPRGGPPRSWTNAELTEALQHVWNKKMTTSQASRIFGIPYNSLLMYVRGKYGKSLKLEQLRKDCISGPPIELLQMGPTAQANENKKKEKSGGDGDEGQQCRDNIQHNMPSSLKRSVSSDPDMMMSQSPLFNPFQGGFYPDFPGAAGFPGLQLSMLNLLPPDARLHHQGMLPMSLDEDCKSDNGSIQSLDDSLPTPLDMNREKLDAQEASRQVYQH